MMKRCISKLYGVGALSLTKVHIQGRILNPFIDCFAVFGSSISVGGSGDEAGMGLPTTALQAQDT